jgi:hypothetical protein
MVDSKRVLSRCEWATSTLAHEMEDLSKKSSPISAFSLRYLIGHKNYENMLSVCLEDLVLSLGHMGNHSCFRKRHTRNLPWVVIRLGVEVYFGKEKIAATWSKVYMRLR